MNPEIKYCMEEALKEAELAANEGEVPVGAVIVLKGEIIARGHNQVERRKDATCHAEILAIQNASKYCSSWRLSEASIFVTLEPCPMCIGALILSRISKLYFGCWDPRMGATGSLFDISAVPALPHQIDVYPEILAEESSALLKSFFSQCRTERQ